MKDLGKRADDLARRMKKLEKHKGQQMTPAKGGGVNVDLLCKICGEPLIGVDSNGMHCKNRCYADFEREARDLARDLMGTIAPRILGDEAEKLEDEPEV